MKAASVSAEKKPKRPKGGPVSPGSASPQARRQAAVILEVLAGLRRPAEAAQVLETSLPRYYQLERRALLGLLAACEPVGPGPGLDSRRRVAALERQNRRLQRECDRQQALVRVTQRSLGLLLPTVKPAGKGKRAQTPEGKDQAARRRARRPTVRALKAAEALQVPEATAVDTTTPPVTAET
jgi:hypothetical protein